MIEAELKQKIVDAIKEQPSELKPALTGMFSRLMELYVAEETLSKNNYGVNIKRAVKINSYAKSVSDIVSGVTGVGKEQLGDADEFFTAEELATIESKPRPVANYWAKSLQKVDAVGSFIMPCDEEALKSLNKVDVEFLPDSDNYNVNFHFAPNEFFENNILTLKFFVDKNEDTEKIEATTINWKAGKCITEKVETKTQTNKKTKKKRTVEKKVQQESFFQLFKNRSADEEEEDEPEEDDSFNLEGIYDAGSIGDSFSLVKYFFTKYHGAAFYEAKIPEFDFGGEGFGDGDDEDGDEEEDDDDAGDDDDKPKRKKSDNKKKGGAAGKDGAKQEECKKQ